MQRSTTDWQPPGFRRFRSVGSTSEQPASDSSVSFRRSVGRSRRSRTTSPLSGFTSYLSSASGRSERSTSLSSRSSSTPNWNRARLRSRSELPRAPALDLAYGMKRGWCESNPVALVEKPRADTNPDIRFLTLDELEAILTATPSTPLGRTDRLVYLTAAMTGMRRGEVIAIRWQDIDWDLARSVSAAASLVASSAPPSHAAPAAPCRSPSGSPMSSRAHYGRRHTETKLTSSSPTQTLAASSTLRSSASASWPVLEQPVSDPCGSTICATPSAPRWPRPAHQCGRSRRGSVTRTSNDPDLRRLRARPEPGRALR